MRRTIVTSEIEVIGKIWMPATMAAYTYKLSDHDIENMWNDEFTQIEDAITREDIEEWLSKNAGDFQEIVDFNADISFGDTQDLIIPWKNEESELIYNDCMFPQDDD